MLAPGNQRAAAVIGTVSIGWAQSGLSENVKTNPRMLAERKAAVDAVPIIKRDLEHIKENMKKDRRDILAAIAEVKEEIDRQ